MGAVMARAAPVARWVADLQPIDEQHACCLICRYEPIALCWLGPHAGSVRMSRCSFRSSTAREVVAHLWLPAAHGVGQVGVVVGGPHDCLPIDLEAKLLKSHAAEHEWHS